MKSKHGNHIDRMNNSDEVNDMTVGARKEVIIINAKGYNDKDGNKYM